MYPCFINSFNVPQNLLALDRKQQININLRWQYLCQRTHTAQKQQCPRVENLLLFERREIERLSSFHPFILFNTKLNCFFLLETCQVWVKSYRITYNKIKAMNLIGHWVLNALATFQLTFELNRFCLAIFSSFMYHQRLA